MENLVASPEQIAIVLRNQRRLFKLTQSDAASRVGLQAKTISGLENRPETVSLAIFYRLLAALDLEVVIRPRSQPAGTTTEW